MIIWALLHKPRGRGHLRCWHGFKCETPDQSAVEDFMIAMGHDKYFFVMDTNIGTLEEYPNNRCYSNGLGSFWVYEVDVKIVRNHTDENSTEPAITFTIDY